MNRGRQLLGESIGVEERYVPARKVEPDQVIERYKALRNLAATGREFGISRERVRQIVNAAGIATSWESKPKPPEEPRLCPQCGAVVTYRRARYCPAHRGDRNKRAYARIKADPERLARFRESIRQSGERRRDRKRTGSTPRSL